MSKNTVAVRLLLDVGFDRVRMMARQLGLTTEVPKSYTAALGTGEVVPLELINAYATLDSLGRKSEPVLIRKVRSRANAIMMQAEGASEQVVKPEIAYITADMMRAVIEDPEGTARSLGILMRPIGGKTGTASDLRDGWFIGFTPSMTAGAWVGFDDHAVLGPKRDRRQHRRAHLAQVHARGHVGHAGRGLAAAARGRHDRAHQPQHRLAGERPERSLRHQGSLHGRHRADRRHLAGRGPEPVLEGALRRLRA
jgi:membrane peptidoglycan carboxypeptidase